MEQTPILIKSYAWKTPLGNAVDPVILRMLAGERAAKTDHLFRTSTYACKIGAPLAESPSPSRQQKFLKRMGLAALQVANEAWKNVATRGVSSDRVGLFFGYGGLRAEWSEMMPALADLHVEMSDCWENGLSKLHPFWILRHLSNNAHAIVAQEIKIHGEGITFGGANSGTQALGAACAALHDGAIDRALIVAHDSWLEPEALVALSQHGVLTIAPVETLASPYDQCASGCVPGEAAAAIVLDRADGGIQKGDVTLQAVDMSDGERAFPETKTLELLTGKLARGNEIIDGASRCEPAHDIQEREMLARHVPLDSPLISTVSSMGHVGSALSVIQAIALAEFLKRRELPPIAGLRDVLAAPLRPLQRSEKTTHQCAIGLCAGTPGLAGAIRVEVHI